MKKHLTAKDLRDYLNTHDIPDEAVLMFDGSTVDGGAVEELISEIRATKIGPVRFLVLERAEE